MSHLLISTSYRTIHELCFLTKILIQFIGLLHSLYRVKLTMKNTRFFVIGKAVNLIQNLLMSPNHD